MTFFDFFKKPTRKAIVNNKTTSLFNEINNDCSNFTTLEKAEIIKNINIKFLKILDAEYNKAYSEQQEILAAKELIK